jgi:hypothetical protein
MRRHTPHSHSSRKANARWLAEESWLSTIVPEGKGWGGAGNVNRRPCHWKLYQLEGCVAQRQGTAGRESYVRIRGKPGTRNFRGTICLIYAMPAEE